MASPSRPSPCSRRLSTSSIQFVPSRQGVHWPQDSWLKNLARRATERTMQTVSSITMIAAEPSMEPALATRVEVHLDVDLDAVRIGAEAPPGMTALSLPCRHMPPAAVEHLAEGDADRVLVDAGPLDVAGDGVELGAGVALVVPIALNQSAPRLMMCGTLQRVSTLLTTVGAPKAPTTAGNGGFTRGWPRLPSSDSSIPVSSPQM